MASTACLRSTDHQGVWRCACAAGGDFCSVCILDHMGTPGEGLAHSITPIATPVGQHVCGRCHGQPTETILFNYEICMCGPCADALRFSREAGHLAEMPRIPAFSEEAFKAHAEAEQKRAAEGRILLSPLQRLIVDKKNGIHQSFMRAYNSMNSFEEIITEALKLENEAQQLRRQLAEGVEVRVEMGNLQEGMDRIEVLRREKEELRNMNSVLAAEMQVLKDQHCTEIQALKNEHQEVRQTLENLLQAAEERLEMQVDPHIQGALENQLNEAVEMLQASIREQTAETARVAAKKVTDVLPLIAEIGLDNSWLDHDSVEKFLELSMLAIGDWISPEKLREVARDCIHIAKFLGPNHLIAEFADNVSKRIKRNKEEGLQLVRAFYGLYELVKDDVKAKEMLSTLLKLLEKGDIFNHVMKILGHLQEVIGARNLCDFTIAASAYFQQEHPRSEEWKKCLISLPVDWSERHHPAAKQCITSFIRVVCDQHFNENYLQVAQLLHPWDDPMLLFALVEKLCIFMKNAAISQELLKLVEQLLALLNSTIPQPYVFAAFGILKHLLRDPQPGEVQLFSNCIVSIHNTKEVAELMIVLVRMLEMIKSQDTTYKLGIGMLKWVLADEHSFRNVAFVQRIIEALEGDPRTLDEASIHAARLLAAPQFQAKQASFLELLNCKVPASIVCEYTAALLNDTQLSVHSELILYTLQMVATNADSQKAVEWIQITKTMMEYNQVVQVYEVYNAFVKRRMQDAEVAELGKCLLTVAQSQVNLDHLKALLNALRRTLNTEGLTHTLVLKIMKLWMSYYRFIPTDPRPYVLAIHLIERLGGPETSTLITAFETTVHHAGGIYVTTTLALVKVYIPAYIASPDRAQQFITMALDVLKRMQNGSQKEKFETLIDKAVRRLQEHSLFFLEGAFRQSVKSPEIIDITLGRFLQLINLPDGVRVLQSLSQGVGYGYCCRLLDIFIPTSEATEAVSKLLDLANYLLQRGLEAPAVTPGLERAVQERPKDVTTLLDALFIMCNTNYAQCHVADELLQELTRGAKGTLPLLCFVATLATDVLNAGVPQQIVERLCTLLRGALNDDSGLLRRFSESKQLLFQSLIKLLSSRQVAVTLKDVEGLVQALPQPAQGRVLAHVQEAAIRTFNFQNRSWNQNVPLNSQIRVDDSSSWTFLDNYRLFCCGGKDYAGYSTRSWSRAGSRSYSVDWKDTYLLTRGNPDSATHPNWTATKLQDMKTARSYHGILYLAQFDFAYVFGGKLYTGGASKVHQ